MKPLTTHKPYFDVAHMNGAYCILCNKEMAQLLNALIHEQTEPVEKELKALKHALYDVLRIEGDTSGFFKRQALVKQLSRLVEMDKENADPEMVRLKDVLSADLRSRIENYHSQKMVLGDGI